MANAVFRIVRLLRRHARTFGIHRRARAAKIEGSGRG